MTMTALDEAILNMHRELGRLGWTICQEVTPPAVIAYYQRVRDGKIERAALVREGSVFGMKPLTQEKRR